MARDYDAAYDFDAEEEYLSQAEYEEMMAEAFANEEPDSALEEELDAYYDDDPNPYHGDFCDDCEIDLDHDHGGQYEDWD